MVSYTQTDLLCACCQRPITSDSDVVYCEICHQPHHRNCWQEHGGCSLSDYHTHLHPDETSSPSDTMVDLPSVSSSLPSTTIPQISNVPSHQQSSSRTRVWVGIGLIIGLIAAAFVARSLGVSHQTILLMGVIVTALGFDFVNGMNDSGNAIATVISTRALPPLYALIMAAVLNFVGAVLMEGVAKNIAGKIIDVHAVPLNTITPLMILCGLLGAIAWSYLMARIGLPISMSHALIGGLVGVLLLARIPLNLSYIGEICLWMILAPILGFTLGWALMLGIMWIFRNVAPHKMNRQFRYWQLLSSGLMAFSHGANDAQKAMGIITLALVSCNFIHTVHGAVPHIPIWVKLACASVIALGTALGGRKVIGTLGHKIFKLTTVHGFAAEAVASGTIQLATMLHVPISTTHVISSSILGVGSSKRLSAVRWGVAGNIVSAWIFTIPTCGAVGALLYGLVRLLGIS
ncbi:MAG TPA: inorganic phosphate transporter [Armatimonadota bacterium]|nr:inorganic phosphate transporter [Armatimonadota bacterium]